MLRAALFLICCTLATPVEGGNDLVDQLYLSRYNPGDLLHDLGAPGLIRHPRAVDNPVRGPSLWDIEPGTFAAWDYQGTNYPRPRNERTDCNVNTQNLLGASICDSNATLTETQRVSLQRKINATLDSQLCQCGSQCTTTDKVAGGRYSIAVAIPEYLSATNSSTNFPCAQTRIDSFANSLRSSRYSDLAKCDDGIVIALSPADQTYTIAVSSRPAKRLSQGCRNTIMEKVRPLVEVRNYTVALEDMVDYINHALKGGRCGEKSGLTSDQVIGIICGVVFGTAFIIFIIVVCVGFFRNWKCVAGTCLGIVVGAILRGIQFLINILIIKCMSAICERFTAIIPACEEPCGCCQCEPLTCVEDVEAGGGGGGGW